MKGKTQKMCDGTEGFTLVTSKNYGYAREKL